MTNAISAADIAFIMSSSTFAWLLSRLECSRQKQNGWTLPFCFWGWIMWKITLTAVMMCTSLRSIWRNRGSSLEVAEHQALLKFRRPLLALAFTGSEVDEADIWASETSSLSTPGGGSSSELRKKKTGLHHKELSWSRICSSQFPHKQNLLAFLLLLRVLCWNGFEVYKFSEPPPPPPPPT